ncbi:agamous-like MADS-box protein AGL62 [Silene latifolia]|uniref:agamous-like MADS-box protein AGL62 n=1 Tax=Silene latifolia TaxID=37657 RepID=UPI003D76CC27
MAEVMKKNPHEASNVQKKTKGKQLIEIKRIENKNARLVAFSKRRKTLFEKLGELYTKFGAEVAAIVFSEAGKLRSCGHPNEDAVIQRFINYLNENSDETNRNKLVGTSKSSIEGHGYENNDNCGGFWWDKPIDNLGLVELERFKVALEGLRNEVATTVDKISCCSMKMQSNAMTEVFHPELLPADAFLSI